MYTKFDCPVKEMLYIRMRKPTLNVQTDSIRAKVFVQALYCNSSAYLALFLIRIRFNQSLDNRDTMTSKRQAINLSWFFICLCFSKSLLIKLTISTYKLNIETGRYHDISRFVRICIVCSLHVQDDIQSLFDCAKYSSIKNNFFLAKQLIESLMTSTYHF